MINELDFFIYGYYEMWNIAKSIFYFYFLHKLVFQSRRFELNKYRDGYRMNARLFFDTN